jgi:hypothetical protein
MLTIRSQRSAFFALAILGFATCCAVRMSAWGEGSDSAKSKLTSLREERRDVLKTRVDVIEHLVGITMKTAEELIAAREDLLDAEYELATSSEQRLGVLQRKLANAKQLEAVKATRKEAGAGTEAEVLLAKARRLGVEIELAKEEETHKKS